MWKGRRWGCWLPCKLSLLVPVSTSTRSRSRSCLPGGLGLYFLAGSYLCFLWWPLTMVVLLAAFALIFAFWSSADCTSSLPHHLRISHWVTTLILGRRIAIAYKRGSPVETFLSVMIWQRWVGTSWPKYPSLGVWSLPPSPRSTEPLDWESEDADRAMT